MVKFGSVSLFNAIGNDEISLSKEFSEKNGSKLTQRYPTNAHADV